MSEFIKYIKRIVPTKVYIYLSYYRKFGHFPNLNKPVTYSEKIQWEKLYLIDETYANFADKYLVRDYVSKTIGEKYLIPLYGVYEKAEDIDFDALPNQFVLKTNHSCEQVIICKDKNNINKEAVIKRLNLWIKQNYFWEFREKQYKKIKPLILCEMYLDDHVHMVPKDFKFYCFEGMPRYVMLLNDRFEEGREITETVLDLDWNNLHCTFDNRFGIDNSTDVEKPENFEEMLSVVKKLCKGFDQIRIDMYVVDTHIYFGEMTLTTASGYAIPNPECWDERLGEMFEIHGWRP